MRIITIGTWSGKICATCQFWEGPTLISSAGSSSNPAKMNFDNTPCNGKCIKKNALKQSTSSCGEHKYNYRCQRYL